jgi:transposase
MDYHRGVDRSQVEMVPAYVEDYVEDNAPVRAIDLYVEGLNFQALDF